MKEACTLLFLGINCWKDIRERQVSLFTAGVFALGGILRALYLGRADIWLLLSVGVGIGLLAISIVTRGALGMGDCWVIAALGAVLGFGELVTMLCISLFLAAIWAAVLLVVFHKGRNAAFPFVPFLLLGYLGGLCL